MRELRDLLLVAMGGGLGACLRYGASRAALLVLPLTFPWGTFLINVTGCFVMGVVGGLALQGNISPSARLFLATGVLGGYTTFSAFGLETHGLLINDRLIAAFLYVTGQILLGTAGVFLGIAVARRLA